MSELRFSQTESLKELPGDTYNLGQSTISGWADKIPTKNAESARYLEKMGVLPSVTIAEPRSNQTDSLKELPGDTYNQGPAKSEGMTNKVSTKKAELAHYLEKTGAVPSVMPEQRFNQPDSSKELPGDAYHLEPSEGSELPGDAYSVGPFKSSELPGDAYHLGPSKGSGLTDKISTKKAELAHYLEKTSASQPSGWHH
ncbi:MAG: hypothetical protein P4L53_04790 [Candidatus Obscuribacterales bacterium]|nr:hypothetical protein [Candidatus Obscuribacterales bacterium]